MRKKVNTSISQIIISFSEIQRISRKRKTKIFKNQKIYDESIPRAQKISTFEFSIKWTFSSGRVKVRNFLRSPRNIRCAPPCAHTVFSWKFLIFLILALFRKLKWRKSRVRSTEGRASKRFTKITRSTCKIRPVQVPGYNSKNWEN